MKVYVVPVDQAGPGYHRLIWPAEALRRQGHDVRVVPPNARNWWTYHCGEGHLHVAGYPADADVIVLARVTHARVAELVEPLRRDGVAVVIDIDDDLTAIHPDNAAFWSMHPRAVRSHAPVPAERLAGRRFMEADGTPGPGYLLSVEENGYNQAWRNLAAACRQATLVTCSTPSLLPVYAAHGRGRVVPNYLAPHYYGLPHEDSEVLGWPGAMWSHPNDPQVTRPGIRRLVDGGARFMVVGSSEGAGVAFGLAEDPPSVGPVPLPEWPAAIAEHIGVGIVPLADTRFNRSKSDLKGLELAACGVPFVASPREEYRRLHASGAGLLAEKPKDWYRQVKRLLADPSLRAELSESGWETARQRSLDANCWRHLEAWSDALALQRKTTPKRGVTAAGHTTR